MNLIVLHGSAACTNAVFTNSLPDFYGEIERYALPIVHPFKTESLTQFSYDEEMRKVHLKPGYRIDMRFGRLIFYEAPGYPAERYRADPGDKITVSVAKALTIASNFARHRAQVDDLARALHDHQPEL